MNYHWHVCSRVCPQEHKSVSARGYDAALEKIYPLVKDMDGGTIIHIWTDRSKTGYSYTLRHWRP
jgi:hypothetical protein